MAEGFGSGRSPPLPDSPTEARGQGGRHAEPKERWVDADEQRLQHGALDESLAGDPHAGWHDAQALAEG